jgi:hypothetical protein
MCAILWTVAIVGACLAIVLTLRDLLPPKNLAFAAGA